MRLTLRTLLAYLDDTLDRQDAEVLRDKLVESGFATQLVERIRSGLANGTLTAPSPEAVGPVEEANVISEYLDSTLPAEQVAEIERACLESEPHLAEAAACHQILTLILGKPAEVSPELRERIYALADRSGEDRAESGSISGGSIPAEGRPGSSLADQTSAITGAAARGGEPVQPVGVSDSGVSDAPARLRAAETSSAGQTLDDAAIADAESASPGEHPSQLYGGSIWPSKITTWIIYLALAGVLLFALTRIFQPLLNPTTVSSKSRGDAEVSVPGDEAPRMVEVDENLETELSESLSNDSDLTESGSARSVDDGDTLPAPDTADPGVDASGATEDQAVTASTSSPGQTTTASESVASETTSSESTTGQPGIDAPASDEPQGESGGSAVATADSVTAEMTGDADATPAGGEAGRDKVGAEDTAPAATKSEVATESEVMALSDEASGLKSPVPPLGSKVVQPPQVKIAKMSGDESLLAGFDGQSWVRLQDEAMVGQGLPIVCAPMFRGQMTTEDATITIVGPARVQWVADEERNPLLHVERGRILVSPTQPDTSLALLLGDEPVSIGFAEVGSVAAASIHYVRAPGYDPLQPENRRLVAGILAVQGAVSVIHAGQEAELETGLQWVKKGAGQPEVSTMGTLPTWIDPPDPATSNLEATARRGLLELLQGDQSLEMALREATLFRRTEVAALAAQTLANLGLGDVYFGGDGILSTPKQRAYWPDHFTTLQASVDRSAASAERLRASIRRMDSANAGALFRLLTGYSQAQLAEGGDQELIQFLDSPSMAVRVLALENLARITGTTLYFRPEQENAVRRAPVIKKWVARLRKGDIRWQE